MIRRTIAAIAAAASCFAAADELPMYWYVWGDDAGQTGFDKADHWYLDGNSSQPATEAPNAAADYGLKDGKLLRSPEPTASGAAYTFNGHSLHLGAMNKSTTGLLLVRNANYHTDLTFANDGVYGHSGYLGSWNAKGFAVRGKLTVDASSSGPFRIFESGGNGGTIDIYAPVHGSGHLWLHSRLTSASQSSTDKRCHFHDDALRDFTGTIHTYWCEYAGRNTARPKDSYSQTFLTDDGSFPGHLNLWRWSAYEGTTPSNVFSVARLTLGEDTIMRPNVGEAAATNSLLVVTDTFTAGGTRLHVRPFGASSGVPTASDLNALTKTAAYTYPWDSLPFLRVPEGTDLAAAAAAFNQPHATAEYPSYRVTADADGRTLRLAPEFKTIVRDIGNSDGWDINSFTGTGSDSPSVWSDGLAPVNPENAYVISYGKSIRSRRSTSQSNATVERFQGGALILYNNDNNMITIQNTSGGLEFPDLRALGGRVSINNLGDYGTGTAFARFPAYVAKKPFEVKGRILMKNAGTADYYFQLNSYTRKAMDVSAEFAGSGRLHVTTLVQDSKKEYDSFVGLFGPNTNFVGHIYVCASGDLVSTNGTHLYIRAPENLGGPRLEWTFNALWLQRNSFLHPLASMTLDTPNLGIYCASTSEPCQNTFDITNDVVFACKARISHASVLRKTGAGTFALGGPHPYFGNTGSTVPVATSNRLVICEGALKPLSSEAFQGLEVVVSNEAAIVMDVPASATDGDVGQYGMRNTEWATPFVLPEGGVTVRLEDAAGRAMAAAGGRVREVAIATVAAGAAGTVRGKLNVQPLTVADGRRLSALPFERTNGDGSITFGVKLAHGTSISLR